MDRMMGNLRENIWRNWKKVGENRKKTSFFRERTLKVGSMS